MTLARAVYDGLAAVLDFASSRGVNVEFDAEAGDDDTKVVVDPAQFKRVLENLLVNAIEAVGNAGEVHVGWHRVDADDVASTFPGYTGDVGCIYVADDGMGIEPSSIETIFEPFYTNKPRGTGLGLAVAREIVESHGGILRARNRDTGGAIFEIFLAVGDRQQCYASVSDCAASCDSCAAHDAARGYCCWAVVGEATFAETGRGVAPACSECAYYRAHNLTAYAVIDTRRD